MKTRTVLFALAAFVIAIGSAFSTSKIAATTAFIKVKYVGDPIGAPYSCVSSGIQCSELASGPACKIEVTTVSGPSNTNGWYPTCVTKIRHNDDLPEGTFEDPEREISQVAQYSGL
jgi:hypothetical protein